MRKFFAPKFTRQKKRITVLVILPYLAQSGILLISLYDQYFAIQYLTQSGVLLVLPYLHRTRMGHFTRFDITWTVAHFATAPYRIGIGDLPYSYQSGRQLIWWHHNQHHEQDHNRHHDITIDMTTSQAASRMTSQQTRWPTSRHHQLTWQHHMTTSQPTLRPTSQLT